MDDGAEDVFAFNIKKEPELDLGTDEERNLDVAPATSYSHCLKEENEVGYQFEIKQEPELSINEEHDNADDNEQHEEDDEQYNEQDEFNEDYNIADDDVHDGDEGNCNNPKEHDNQDASSQRIKDFLVTYLPATKDRPFQCHYCKKDFARAQDLERHERVYRKSEVQCTFCPEQFHIRCALKEHLKSHPKQKQKSAEVKSHTGEIKTVTEDDLFKCPHCPKILSRKRCTVHLRIHSGWKPFQCPHCPKSFVTSYRKEVHIRTHTGERPYKCYCCPKTFAQSGTRDNHYRTHTGVKPFSCSHCARAFTTAKSRDEHELVHTGERPFTCTICSKTFARNNIYKKHLLIHQKETQ